MNLNRITLPTLDITASVAFYRELGFEQIVDSPHYARFMATAGDASFSLQKVDAVSANNGVVVYFECARLDEQVAELISRTRDRLPPSAMQRTLAVARGALARSRRQPDLPVTRRPQPT